MALGGRYYLHYPLSYHLYCPDRPDHVLRRYEHSLETGSWQLGTFFLAGKILIVIPCCFYR